MLCQTLPLLYGEGWSKIIIKVFDLYLKQICHIPPPPASDNSNLNIAFKDLMPMKALPYY